MLRSQIEHFVESIRSEITSIHNAIQEHINSVRDAAKATDEQQGEIARVIASAIQGTYADVPSYEKAQRDKEYRLQRRLFWATLGAGIAAAIYAGIAAYQVRLMHEAIAQTKRSNDIAASSVRQNQWQFQQTLHQMQLQSNAMQGSAASEVSVARAWIVPDAPPRNKGSIQEANLEWHNAGKSPAVSVFSKNEYFIGEFPSRLRSCDQMERYLKKSPVSTWQYQGFVSQGGRYEIGLSNVPAWQGQAPISIHGCVWYTDILSNKERYTEYFLQAFQGKFGFPASPGVSLFYLSERPFVYK